MSNLLFSFAIVLVVIPVLAQQTQAQDSWLDRRLVNWNRHSRRFAQLPKPPATAGDFGNSRECRQRVRQPANAAERALVRRGWTMYGPVYSYDLTRVVTALSGFEGMCRPLGTQAFVYWEGRYAGTLSPVPMDSRTDGTLTSVHVGSATSISADFARYAESDPLCCPSRISSVAYSLRGDDPPVLIARNVIHRPTRESVGPELTPSGSQADSLFGKRWTLVQLEERMLSTGRPYIEFAADQRRVSGSGGCNSFAGTFETDGSTLTLSRIASTKRACLDPELQRIETGFLRLLETTTRFEVQRNILRLYADDRLVLGFLNK